jgi:hypothetical protein
MYNLDQSQKDEQKEVITLASQEQQSESPQLRQGSFKYLGVDVYQSDILTLETGCMVNDTIVNILFE